LQGDVLRCAKHGNRGEEIKPEWTVLKGDREHGQQGGAKVERAPARRDAGIVENLRQELARTVVEDAADRFAVQTLHQRPRDGFPICDAGRSPSG
jgi:hypothetical protein